MSFNDALMKRNKELEKQLDETRSWAKKCQQEFERTLVELEVAQTKLKNIEVIVVGQTVPVKADVEKIRQPCCSSFRGEVLGAMVKYARSKGSNTVFDAKLCQSLLFRQGDLTSVGATLSGMVKDYPKLFDLVEKPSRARVRLSSLAYKLKFIN